MGARAKMGFRMAHQPLAGVAGQHWCQLLRHHHFIAQCVLLGKLLGGASGAEGALAVATVGARRRNRSKKCIGSSFSGSKEKMGKKVVR